MIEFFCCPYQDCSTKRSSRRDFTAHIREKHYCALPLLSKRNGEYIFKSELGVVIDFNNGILIYIIKISMEHILMGSTLFKSYMISLTNVNFIQCYLCISYIILEGSRNLLKNGDSIIVERVFQQG